MQCELKLKGKIGSAEHHTILVQLLCYVCVCVRMRKLTSSLFKFYCRVKFIMVLAFFYFFSSLFIYLFFSIGFRVSHLRMQCGLVFCIIIRNHVFHSRREKLGTLHIFLKNAINQNKLVIKFLYEHDRNVVEFP